MNKVPKIERLVSDLEDELSDVTIDSVWLVKKTKKDVAIKQWHLGMKHTKHHRQNYCYEPWFWYLHRGH
jgi:hypothetical protein